MQVLITDLESVLIPEIWVEIAENTGVKELKVTTREMPDYKKLMHYRLKILKENKINFDKIKNIISGIEPFSYAKQFLENVSKKMEIIIVTGSFYEFARPVVDKLGNYTLMANNLVINNGYIEKCVMRISDDKDKPVKLFNNLGFSTIGVGDSFNDLKLLKASKHPILFNPSEKVKHKLPQAKEARNLKKLEKEVLGIVNN